MINAKLASFWSTIYLNQKTKVLKNKAKRYFRSRIKRNIRRGYCNTVFFVEQGAIIWEYVPYTVEWLKKKGYKCSCKIINPPEPWIGTIYRVKIAWGEF